MYSGAIRTSFTDPPTHTPHAALKIVDQLEHLWSRYVKNIFNTYNENVANLSNIPFLPSIFRPRRRPDNSLLPGLLLTSPPPPPPPPPPLRSLCSLGRGHKDGGRGDQEAAEFALKKKSNYFPPPKMLFFCYQVALGHGGGGDSRLAAAVDYPETNKKN